MPPLFLDEFQKIQLGPMVTSMVANPARQTDPPLPALPGMAPETSEIAANQERDQETRRTPDSYG
jgi:hypothetical protein